MKKNNNKLVSFTSGIAPKIFALLAAIVVFFIIEYFQIIDRKVVIPLEVILPESGEIEPESLVPTNIEILISGSDRLVYLVEPDKIQAVADFSKVTEPGIARIPVELKYDMDVFDRAEIIVTAAKPVVRILFRSTDD